VHWQGAISENELRVRSSLPGSGSSSSSSEALRPHTIKEGMERIFGKSSISYHAGVDIDSTDLSTLSASELSYIDTEILLQDLVLLCLGEESSVEKPGDTSSLDLSKGQMMVCLCICNVHSLTLLVLLFFSHPLSLPFPFLATNLLCSMRHTCWTRPELETCL
jgi:hypothetical protein